MLKVCWYQELICLLNKCLFINGGQLENKLVGTSWKMNKNRSEALQFAGILAASDLAQCDAANLFVIPPFPYIYDVAQALEGTKIRVGAQNMHWQDCGPWTGEVSPLMVKDCGASLVEIGHSERRANFGETDATVALKVAAAIRHSLVPLVCIGDTKEEYEKGRTTAVLARQTQQLLSLLAVGDRQKVVVAYEPVWSIGEGGTPASPEFAEQQHVHIKSVGRALGCSNLTVIYGGSVNPENCAVLAGQSHIDGLFIGRAAWQPEGYLEIVKRVIDLNGANS
jgi:L-erythrulose 1-phosphate isomerase